MKNKKIFLFILIFLFTFIGFSFIIYDVFFKIKLDNTNIKFIKDLEAEIYSDANVSDYVKSIDGKILDNKFVDTTSLGDKEIVFLYQNSEGKRKLGSVTVKVVDSTSPIIFISSSYTVLKNSEELSTDILMSVDNYDSNPKREIIGNYDINQIGEYNLTYQVTDSSGNISKKEFVLKVVNSIENNNDRDDSYTDFNEVVKTHKTENTMIGIDVSKWQGDIDFEKVKEASAEFVMIRIGYQDGIDGESIMDPYFEENIEGAIENNLKVGIYYYSHAKNVNEAREQALWVVDRLDDYQIDLPVVFDWENWSKFNLYEVSLYDINMIADTFRSVIERYNYDYMLYGSKYYLNNIWNVSNKNIWLAHYTSKTDYNNRYMMWQLCDNGKIDGIDGNVDIDILYL